MMLQGAFHAASVSGSAQPERYEKAKRAIAFWLEESWGAIRDLEKNCLGFTIPMRHSACWTAALTFINRAARLANDSGKFLNEKERNA